MVADYDLGTLERSLVRVPESGSDNTLPSVALDLGRVSDFASTVRVSTILPPALCARNLKRKLDTDNSNQKRKIQKLIIYNTLLIKENERLRTLITKFQALFKNRELLENVVQAILTRKEKE